MAYAIGDRIGDYQIVDVLGAGGMGKVYKVKNVISDRVEAMKVLLPNLESDPELADRFMREIKVQASLQHPNIAGLHTAQRINNQLIMLLEFVEGMTLEARLRQGRIPIAEGVEYVKQVLSALAYSHTHGVVHRDIKPANMMLTPKGVVKLMDFGIAKAAADRKLTQTGRTVGSLYYMSPEQIQGALDLDGRSDLYSVGVSLYEMVTGRRPFQGDSDYSIMAAHLNASPVPPLEIDRSLPAALNDIILMAIEKDPNRRFQTADAFRSALSTVPLTAVQPVVEPITATIGGSSPPRAGAVPMSQLPSGPLPSGPPPSTGSLPPSSVPAEPSSRRGIYMAAGSVVTIIALAVAAIQGPKFFTSSAQVAAVPSTQSSASPPVASAAVEATPQKTSRVPLPEVPQSTLSSDQVAGGARHPGGPLRSTGGQLPETQPTSPVSTPQAATTLTAQNRDPALTNLQLPPTPVRPDPPNVPDPGAANPAKEQEIEELKERMLLVATRANSVRASLSSMRRQMGGMNLNAEFTDREQRMEVYLDQAEASLKGMDPTRAKRHLEAAERVLEQLEKKLGR